ncbi:MAG: helix-turn-helix transcriptional regulator [Oscillospiraceae bacterium]|nr:helix-turn-helix transcriptional regulator [Oscillospiraceae bacterium]
MKTREAVQKRILELCAQRDLTVNALATAAGLPPSTLKNILYGVSKNPGVVTIKILCDGLDITLSDFFDSDIFRTLEQEIE